MMPGKSGEKPALTRSGDGDENGMSHWETGKAPRSEEPSPKTCQPYPTVGFALRACEEEMNSVLRLIKVVSPRDLSRPPIVHLAHMEKVKNILLRRNHAAYPSHCLHALFLPLGDGDGI